MASAFLPPGSTTSCQNLCHWYQTPKHVLGGSEPLCLPTGTQLGQSGGKVAGLPVQQNYSDCSVVTQHALVWGSGAMSSQILLCLPNLLTQLFYHILHKNMPNLNLHAWFLEPQLSRSRASLRQWQHKLRLLRESQPQQSVNQGGPFLQSGESVIKWTSGQTL